MENTIWRVAHLQDFSGMFSHIPTYTHLISQRFKIIISISPTSETADFCTKLILLSPNTCSISLPEQMDKCTAVCTGDGGGEFTARPSISALSPSFRSRQAEPSGKKPLSSGKRVLIRLPYVCLYRLTNIWLTKFLKQFGSCKGS